MNAKKIYLSGFETCSKDYFTIIQKMRKLCNKYGFIGICYEGVDDSEEEFFINKIKAIERSDILIANLNFFRGDNIWDTTAFEIGYAYAKEKPIYGYISDMRSLKEKIGMKYSKDIIKETTVPISLLISMSTTIIKGDLEQCLKFIYNVNK